MLIKVYFTAQTELKSKTNFELSPENSILFKLKHYSINPFLNVLKLMNDPEKALFKTDKDGQRAVYQIEIKLLMILNLLVKNKSKIQILRKEILEVVNVVNQSFAPGSPVRNRYSKPFTYNLI